MIDVVIIGSLPKKYGGGTGGIATHVDQLSEELAKKGVCVTVYSDVSVIEKVNENHVIIGLKNKKIILSIVLTRPYEVLRRIVKKDLSGLKSFILTEVIKKKHSPKNTVIHIHSLHNYLCSDEVLDLFNCIYTDHGYWQSESSSKDILLGRINKAKKIISVSFFAQEILRKEFKCVESEKFEVIHNPIKTDLNKCLHETSRNYCFFNGYSDSVSRKGFDEFHYLAENNWSEDFIAITDQQGVDFFKKNELKNLELQGKCDYSKIIEIYKKSKLMVLPSKSESFGLVYIEAAYYGVPVIGFAPVINEFNQYLGLDIGLPYDPSNQNRCDLLKLYRKMISTNYDHSIISNKVEEKFSWENKVNEFINIYNSKL